MRLTANRVECLDREDQDWIRAAKGLPESLKQPLRLTIPVSPWVLDEDVEEFQERWPAGSPQGGQFRPTGRRRVAGGDATAGGRLQDSPEVAKLRAIIRKEQAGQSREVRNAMIAQAKKGEGPYAERLKTLRAEKPTATPVTPATPSVTPIASTAPVPGKTGRGNLPIAHPERLRVEDEHFLNNVLPEELANDLAARNVRVTMLDTELVEGRALGMYTVVGKERGLIDVGRRSRPGATLAHEIGHAVGDQFGYHDSAVAMQAYSHFKGGQTFYRVTGGYKLKNGGLGGNRGAWEVFAESYSMVAMHGHEKAASMMSSDLPHTAGFARKWTAFLHAEFFQGGYKTRSPKDAFTMRLSETEEFAQARWPAGTSRGGQFRSTSPRPDSPEVAKLRAIIRNEQRGQSREVRNKLIAEAKQGRGPYAEKLKALRGGATPKPMPPTPKPPEPVNIPGVTGVGVAGLPKTRPVAVVQPPITVEPSSHPTPVSPTGTGRMSVRGREHAQAADLNYLDNRLPEQLANDLMAANTSIEFVPTNMVAIGPLSSALGAYWPSTGNIKVGRKSRAGITVAHEVGHAVGDRLNMDHALVTKEAHKYLGRSDAFYRVTNGFSMKGDANRQEFFAESFALVSHLGPEKGARVISGRTGNLHYARKWAHFLEKQFYQGGYKVPNSTPLSLEG